MMVFKERERGAASDFAPVPASAFGWVVIGEVAAILPHINAKTRVGQPLGHGGRSEIIE